jgi:hypothetical protein
LDARTEDGVVALSNDREGNTLGKLASDIKAGGAIDGRFEVIVDETCFVKDFLPPMCRTEQPDVV